jgi:hypothetical protein
VDKPKTIADLGDNTERDKPIIGKSMIDHGPKSVSRRIEEAQKRHEEEQKLLEAGGYDYGGTEAFERAMRNVGRW